jgi:hypothetical protein
MTNFNKNTQITRSLKITNFSNSHISTIKHYHIKSQISAPFFSTSNQRSISKELRSANIKQAISNYSNSIYQRTETVVLGLH